MLNGVNKVFKSTRPMCAATFTAAAAAVVVGGGGESTVHRCSTNAYMQKTHTGIFSKRQLFVHSCHVSVT